MDKWTILKTVMQSDLQIMREGFGVDKEHDHWMHFIHCVEIYLDLMEELEAEEIGRTGT